MEPNCIARTLQLKAANIHIRMCGDEVEVGISPIWDNIERHEYVAIGKVDEVINELKQLSQDILEAVKVLEEIVMSVPKSGKA